MSPAAHSSSGMICGSALANQEKKTKFPFLTLRSTLPVSSGVLFVFLKQVRLGDMDWERSSTHATWYGVRVNVNVCVCDCISIYLDSFIFGAVVSDACEGSDTLYALFSLYDSEIGRGSVYMYFSVQVQSGNDIEND